MVTFKDYFSTKSDSYANYRPTYPHALAEQLANLCNEKNIALDCGCGSGQFSILLADYFNSVVATDAAAIKSKVQYRIRISNIKLLQQNKHCYQTTLLILLPLHKQLTGLILKNFIQRQNVF